MTDNKDEVANKQQTFEDGISYAIDFLMKMHESARLRHNFYLHAAIQLAKDQPL